MAKIAFSKLGLKKISEIKTVTIKDQSIEVKQYLPVNEKLNLIGRIISLSHDENNFPNPVKIEVIGTLEIIMAYTNLSFTEKQKEDMAKLYDLLDENDIINQLIAAIPKEEYDFLLNGLNDTIEAVYKYQNSVLGILDTIATDYSDLSLDATNIEQKLANQENLGLLREVLTKMG